jgi:hypothetical protein
MRIVRFLYLGKEAKFGTLTNAQWHFWYGYNNQFDFIRVGLEWRDRRYAKLFIILLGVQLALWVPCPVFREKI